MTEKHVLKYGTGYELVIVKKSGRLHMGIRCHTCNLTSFHPKDITERYCACCHRFHEDGLLAHEG